MDRTFCFKVERELHISCPFSSFADCCHFYIYKWSSGYHVVRGNTWQISNMNIMSSPKRETPFTWQFDTLLFTWKWNQIIKWQETAKCVYNFSLVRIILVFQHIINILEEISNGKLKEWKNVLLLFKSVTNWHFKFKRKIHWVGSAVCFSDVPIHSTWHVHCRF